jgi:hypothetical protein
MAPWYPTSAPSSAEDTGGVPGVVGRNYVSVQDSQGFRFLNELIRDGSLYAHRTGSFRGGARVRVQAKLPSTIRVLKSDDLVDDYLLLCNKFNGSSALRILFRTRVDRLAKQSEPGDSPRDGARRVFAGSEPKLQDCMPASSLDRNIPSLQRNSAPHRKNGGT